ncbi:ABC transporter substrate-binding protein [Aerococcus christensenii]|uniref:SsuA/THI5-like domain-containing protein n=2 Tax=Aerococcus christensenii TaxID=87541 RepID=A0A133Y118_9LACT|nr:ABC transporter substrate-binding protein [Aerococcus christensenii]KXB36883.1 hypothetical protein HMPREF3187_00677 [Aerococcus christensenii]MDK8234498.1 ABC transporter substrate-binding protein [Aerococcus christensenii]
MKLKKFMKTIGVIFGVLLLSVTLSACGKSSNAVKPYRIGVLRINDNIPLYVGEAEDFFKKEGVPIEIVEFNSTVDQQNAMEAGELDGVTTDLIVGALFKKGNCDVRAVATCLGATQEEGRFLVVSSPKSNLVDPKDLPHKPLAIAENTMMEYLVDQYSKELGMDPKDLQKVQFPKLLLRLESVLAGKDIQAAILPDPLAEIAVKNGAHVLIDDTKLKENYSQSVLLLSEKRIKEDKEGVHKFLTAYQKAEKALNENPDKYKDLAIEKANIPSQLANDYKVPHFTPQALPSEKDVERIMNWMLEKKLLDKPYSYEEMVYNGF